MYHFVLLCMSLRFVWVCMIFNWIDECCQTYLESPHYDGQQPVFHILLLGMCVNVLFWEDVLCWQLVWDYSWLCRGSVWNCVSSRKSYSGLIFESFLDLCLAFGNQVKILYWNSWEKEFLAHVDLTFCTLCAYKAKQSRMSLISPPAWEWWQDRKYCLLVGKTLMMISKQDKKN